MLPKIQAEKNNLAFEEAEAKLKQLQETYELKRRAAAADIRILEIRRDRSETNMKQAEANAERMLIASPLPGVAVVKTTFKNGGNMVEFMEGDEVRPGQPVVEVVNPAVMRVRARVNQADMNDLRVGPARPGRARRVSRAGLHRHASTRFRRSASSPRCRRRSAASSCSSWSRGRTRT